MSNGVTITVRSPQFKIGEYVKWGDVYGYVKAGTGKIVESFSRGLHISFDENGQKSTLSGWYYVIEDTNGQRLRSEAPESELSNLSSEEFILNIINGFGITVNTDRFCIEGYEKDHTVGSKGKITITGYLK